jgi:hypothetical protein
MHTMVSSGETTMTFARNVLRKRLQTYGLVSAKPEDYECYAKCMHACM